MFEVIFENNNKTQKIIHVFASDFNECYSKLYDKYLKWGSYSEWGLNDIISIKLITSNIEVI